MRTTGNTVFITGSSAGIGLAIAKKLHAAGNKVIINGRHEDRLSEAAESLGGTPFIQGDISKPEERIRVAGILKESYPETNIIVNNAGEGYIYLLKENAGAFMKAEAEMNTNYLSIIHFTELMLSNLLLQREAAVINMSSILALTSEKYLPTYGATKAALHSYTEALRKTYEENAHFQVYELLPPLVNTAFSAEIGGADGIEPSEVADELYAALGKNQFEVPVGQTKQLFAAH